MTDGIRVDRRPARSGAALAVLSGALAVAVIADTDGQRVALALELVALAAVALGVARLRADDRLVGIPLVTVGGLGVLGAIGYGVRSATQMTEIVELVPGLVGVGLLALGCEPVRSGWSRVLVAAGAIAIGIGIATSGVVHGAGRLQLLVGMALAVIAWDFAEQAVSLGGQVGRRGASASVVATHGAWSVGVGAVGVGLASGVYALDVSGLPLVGVGLLLAAAVAIAAAAFT